MIHEDLGIPTVQSSTPEVDAPCYVTNAMIHEDLGIPAVQEVTHTRSINHRIKLENHSNPLLHPIPRDNVVRRLKRRRVADL